MGDDLRSWIVASCTTENSTMGCHTEPASAVRRSEKAERRCIVEVRERTLYECPSAEDVTHRDWTNTSRTAVNGTTISHFAPTRQRQSLLRFSALNTDCGDPNTKSRR